MNTLPFNQERHAPQVFTPKIKAQWIVLLIIACIIFGISCGRRPTSPDKCDASNSVRVDTIWGQNGTIIGFLYDCSGSRR